MEDGEYRLMAAVENRHWWYKACRKLLFRMLAGELEGQDASTYRVLDAGCGVGATGGWLSRHGRVWALDTSKQALNLYAEAYPEATLLEGSVESVPLDDSSIDLLLCVTVLYHANVEDPRKAISEFVRVLRPGGLMCLVEPGGRRMKRGHDHVTHGARRFDLDELRNLVEGAGVVIERSTGAFSFLLLPAWIRSKLPDGRRSSDLSNNVTGLFGLLGSLASIERRILRRRSLPVGLSVVVVGRKP